MSFKDWCLVIGFSVLMLAVIVLVMSGIQAVIIDTGRAIVH
jgi:hypothetical protein